MPTGSTLDIDSALTQLDAAAHGQHLTASSAAMIRRWLAEPRFADYAAEVVSHIAAGKWKELDDAFWTIIPFGTGGRRGKMYPIGSNAVNDRTIGESAQGVADYIAAQFPGEPHACAIAYDTRHNSRRFAELCAEVMTAAGFKVYFLDCYRSTPELSFAVRFHRCTCGIMVTASHNPPSDNAVKVYWRGGVQVLPPHDKAIIERVMNVDTVRRKTFAQALAAGEVIYCQNEVDAAFIAAVKAQALPGPRELKVIYSPLHGVGASAVVPALAADGFTDVTVFGPHATPDGNFTNVPGNVANPENPAVFDAMIKEAQATGADVILATDPDCDRLGAAAALAASSSSAAGAALAGSSKPTDCNPWASRSWRAFSGNQIAALLCEYVLAARKKAGSLSPQHYICKTLVTTEMVRRIADHYGIATHGDLQVGFKWIGKDIDDSGPEKFVFGCEESHGYLVGTHARDKDAAVAAMLLAELASACKAAKQTLHDKLDSLYWQFGYHAESQFSLTMPGAQGMQDMLALMARLRASPPAKIAGSPVARVRDFLSLTASKPGEPGQPFAGPKNDMVMLDLAAEGNYIAVRPSGTEPKVKFYTFTYEPAEQIANLEETKVQAALKLKQMETDLAAFAAG